MRVAGFIRQFLIRPGVTGAVAPSSRALAELIVATAGVPEASVVVELGPGTGVFTEEIQRRLAPGAIFFAIEINPEFVRATKERCPAAMVHEGSAVDLRKFLLEHGQECCDAIVCGLPWASFEESLQDALLDAIVTTLNPGGRFATFAYLQGLALPAGQRFRRKLKQVFSSVTTTKTVWTNLPPAFVYRGVKERGVEDDPGRRSTPSVLAGGQHL